MALKLNVIKKQALSKEEIDARRKAAGVKQASLSEKSQKTKDSFVAAAIDKAKREAEEALEKVKRDNEAAEQQLQDQINEKQKLLDEEQQKGAQAAADNKKQLEDQIKGLQDDQKKQKESSDEDLRKARESLEQAKADEQALKDKFQQGQQELKDMADRLAQTKGEAKQKLADASKLVADAQNAGLDAEAELKRNAYLELAARLNVEYYENLDGQKAADMFLDKRLSHCEIYHTVEKKENMVSVSIDDKYFGVSDQTIFSYDEDKNTPEDVFKILCLAKAGANFTNYSIEIVDDLLNSENPKDVEIAKHNMYLTYLMAKKLGGFTIENEAVLKEIGDKRKPETKKLAEEAEKAFESFTKDKESLFNKAVDDAQGLDAALQAKRNEMLGGGAPADPNVPANDSSQPASKKKGSGGPKGPENT